MPKSACDWVREANDAASSDQKIRLLREAEDAAEYSSEWQEIAQAHAQRGPAGYEDAQRCAERALAGERRSVRPYRNAAVLYLKALGDPEGARALLDRCAGTLRSDPDPKSEGAARFFDQVRYYDWVLLAEGYQELFGAAAEVSTCLEQAVALAREPQDYCAISGTYERLLDDNQTARALFARAEALASTSDAGSWSTIANHFRNSDPERARQCLERGLAQARTHSECTALALGFSHHRIEEGPERCLDKGASLARRAHEWIYLADVANDLAESRVRPFLEGALAASPDVEDRHKIAYGFRHWLNDPERADAISPRGLRPTAILRKVRTLAGWNADPDGLFDWLCAHMTTESLRKIAEADYDCGTEKHLVALQDIAAFRLVPRPIPWSPVEVLELARWADGQKVDHLARAFASTLLCLNDDAIQSLPGLLESVIELGPGVLALLVGFLTALIEADEEDDTTGHIYLQLALLFAASAQDPRDPRLGALAGDIWVMEHTRGGAVDAKSDAWLRRLMRSARTYRRWRLLAARCLDGAQDPRVARIAAALKEETASEAPPSPPDE